MIYCRIKETEKDKATYYVGTKTDNMTGLIVFHKNKPPLIERMPDDGYLPVKAIASIFAKYKSEFANGTFKEKLSYEIG